MRHVSGFERPLLQWLFVAIGVLLVVVAAAEAIGLWRLRTTLNLLRAENLNARLERQELEMRMAREQSAREALSLEVGRLRGAHAGSNAPAATLTLTPLKTRGATPPPATVEAPAAAQPIEVRLLLPAGRDARAKSYAVSFRSWSGGEVIWSRRGLITSIVDGRPAVTARITGDVLAPGSYELLLTEADADNQMIEVASYEVTVRPSSR